MVQYQKMAEISEQNGTISERFENSPTKLVPFEKRLKNPQQKWYHLRKYANLAPLNPLKLSPLLTQKILKRGFKMVPFQKMAEIPEQNWYHFRKCPIIPNKNGTISEKVQNSLTKMVPFQKRPKNARQNRYNLKTAY